MAIKGATQIFLSNTATNVCDVPFGDFVVWTKSELACIRITKNVAFIEEKLDDAQHFFIYGILPEIIGKWYSRKPVATADGVVHLPKSKAQATVDRNDDDDDDPEKLWCYCSKPAFGEMNMCDNKKCTIRWDHYDCLCLKETPKGKWYCPSCMKK